MDIDQYEKNTYRIIPTCIFGLMIFPYDRIVRSPSFNANRFISIIDEQLKTSLTKEQLINSFDCFDPKK